MMAHGIKTDRNGHQELLKGGRGPARQYGDSKHIRQKAFKMLKRKRLQFRIKRDSVKRVKSKKIRPSKTVSI
jgi:hypothetical protein